MCILNDTENESILVQICLFFILVISISASMHLETSSMTCCSWACTCTGTWCWTMTCTTGKVCNNQRWHNFVPPRSVHCFCFFEDRSSKFEVRSPAFWRLSNGQYLMPQVIKKYRVTNVAWTTLGGQVTCTSSFTPIVRFRPALHHVRTFIREHSREPFTGISWNDLVSIASVVLVCECIIWECVHQPDPPNLPESWPL